MQKLQQILHSCRHFRASKHFLMQQNYANYPLP